ncbi:DUF2158 domain-containing protein [Mesorhizobium sp. NPDC059025]|uniref:DUF2158 domain-containing protein n=1 Tax=unclassified Mesorhizobium TaxID=325217 RepID=UPI0036BAAB38
MLPLASCATGCRAAPCVISYTWVPWEGYMADEIKPGSVVQLKSGGPKMTVSWAEDNYGVLSAACDWFIQDKTPWKKESAVFPITSLKLLEP